MKSIILQAKEAVDAMRLTGRKITDREATFFVDGYLACHKETQRKKRKAQKRK